jgi:Restriction endonuclease
MRSSRFGQSDFGGRVVIQAKRYKNTAGVSAVRDLFGTLQNEGASKGILVTTSGYGTASFDFAQNKPIELIDGASKNTPASKPESNWMRTSAQRTGMCQIRAVLVDPLPWLWPRPCCYQVTIGGDRCRGISPAVGLSCRIGW